MPSARHPTLRTGVRSTDVKPTLKKKLRMSPPLHDLPFAQHQGQIRSAFHARLMDDHQPGSIPHKPCQQQALLLPPERAATLAATGASRRKENP